MDITVLFAVVLLFTVALLRPVVAHHCAVKFDGKTIATSSGVWVTIGAIATYPFFGHMWHDALPTLLAHPWLAALAISKGLLAWVIIAMQQQLRRHSQSSTEYYKFVSLGLLAIVNAFFGEQLGIYQLISVGALALLGGVFMLRGHLKSLQGIHKTMFFALIFVGATPGMFDHAVLADTNWYTLLLLSGIGVLSGALFTKRPAGMWKNIFTNKTIIASGLFMFVTEIAVLSVLVTVIPVTMGALVMRLAIPCTMVISAFCYKEGKWTQQAAFGLLAYAAVVPLVLLG